MAKRRREPDSGAATGIAEFNTLFVDTSLDTHLAMLVSSSDTVSDFKKKMALEHKQCFPSIGKIQIHSVKVKRKSNFYHLPDIMLVWSAFDGVKGNWFLSVDASSSPTCHSIKNSSELDTSNDVKMGATNVDGSCRGLSSGINKMHILPLPLPDGATEKNLVSEEITGLKFEKSMEKFTDFHSNTCSEENFMGTDSRAKKKCETRSTGGASHCSSLEDACALFQASSKDASIPRIVGALREISGGGILHEEKGKSLSDATAKVSVVRNDLFDAEDRLVFEGTSTPTAAGKCNLGSNMASKDLLASDEGKEDNLLESKMDYELAQDDPTNYLENASVKVSDFSATLMDADGGVGEINTEGINRKKKKVQKTARNIKNQKTARNIKNTADMEQTGGESVKPCRESHKSEKREEQKGLSLAHDHEVVIPSSSKVSDHVDPDIPLKEESISLDACAVIEPEISSGIKKKKKNRKREKESAKINLEKSGIEQTNNGVTGSSCLLLSSTDRIPEKTGKEEGITHHEGEDVQMLNISTLDAREKVQDVIGNEPDFVILTQTAQTLEDVGTKDKMMDKKTQNSAGNFHAVNPAVETELEQGNENAENKDRKAPKKRKKRKVSALDVQENLPVEDQQVGTEALATKETSIGLVNSEEGKHVASSQVLSSKTEEKLNKVHGIAENSVDLEKTSEKEGEGVDFKYVPGEYQDKVDFGDKVKRATKSNQGAKTSKKFKNNALPSMANLSKLQNSIKSFENKKAEDKSSKKGSGRSKGDTTQNSDWGEMIPNSLKRSSGASEKGVGDTSPSEMCDTALQKHDKILAASSCLSEKMESLYKSCAERSKIFPKKQGNKKSQLGLNVTNMMLMKTPKKNLFTKSGTIFQDNSGESSGDENGTMHSDGSTLSPSECSSMSGYSVVESDLSQDSTRNESNDADGRSTGPRNMLKLDLSASKDMTMDMILRSSKRFKKAKLLASQNEDEQNESQPMEFVPHCQPI